MSAPTRRGFITGCSAAVAAFAGTQFNTLAFGDPEADNQDVLVTVFLRGGMDSLNLVLPRSGADRGHYEAARPEIQVPLSGPNAALALGSQLGFHPATNTWPSGTTAPPATLFDLYQDGKLALVVGSGMHQGNRSHFDSMTYMELGTPGSLTTSTGWLTRHMASATSLPPEITIPSLAVGNLQQNSLRGSTDTLNMTSPDNFSLEVGPYQWRNAQRVTVVMQSEFGRRLFENADRSCDHGHGSLMMVLGGPVNGGIHGIWPGLSNEELFEGADLEVTTDYRRVLSEVLIRRMGNPYLGEVFPGYQDYSPLGIVQGTDLPPIYGPEIFADGFESGDLSSWSASTL